jgi:hypothetical protein
MSIPENLSPAIGALTVPPTIEDATARIVEFTIEHPITGLIGLLFAGTDQFKQAMLECGWTLDEIEPFMSSKTATTYLGVAKRKGKLMRFLLHSYRHDDGDQNVRVINCAEFKTSGIPDDAEKKETTQPQSKQPYELEWPVLK